MGYEPAEAAVKLMGGNSNWRGPVWFPTTYLLIHSFLRFGDAVGERLLPAHRRQQRSTGYAARNRRGKPPTA